MKIGTTFEFEGNQYSIKNIDLDDSDKKRFPTGRLNASKFKGAGAYRTLQAGRPKAFDLQVVAEILGVPVESANIVEDVENADIPKEISASWDNFRKTPVERVDEVINMLPDKSTESEW